MSLHSFIICAGVHSSPCLPWKVTTTPKIALRHREVTGADMINGYYVMEIRATSLSRLMAAAACSKQFVVYLVRERNAEERRKLTR